LLLGSKKDIIIWAEKNKNEKNIPCSLFDITSWIGW
jgi:hypothetical protein